MFLGELEEYLIATSDEVMGASSPSYAETVLIMNNSRIMTDLLHATGQTRSVWMCKASAHDGPSGFLAPIHIASAAGFDSDDNIERERGLGHTRTFSISP